MCEEGSKTDDKDGYISADSEDRDEPHTTSSRRTSSTQSQIPNNQEQGSKSLRSDRRESDGHNSQPDTDKRSKVHEELSKSREGRRVEANEDNVFNKDNKDIQG